jgi:hypothetical protein
MPQNTVLRPQEPGANMLRLLAFVKGMDANAAAVDVRALVINSDRWNAHLCVLCNASISLTTATLGIYSAPAAGGTALITAATALAPLSGPTVVFKPAITTAGLIISFRPSAGASDSVYFRIATAQGAAATFDAYIYGYDLS